MPLFIHHVRVLIIPPTLLIPPPLLIYPSLHPSIYNILKSHYSPPTSVAGNEPHGVTFWLFDRHKQRGCACYQYGHMTGRPWELWMKHLDRVMIKMSSA